MQKTDFFQNFGKLPAKNFPPDPWKFLARSPISAAQLPFRFCNPFENPIEIDRASSIPKLSIDARDSASLASPASPECTCTCQFWHFDPRNDKLVQRKNRSPFQPRCRKKLPIQRCKI